MIWVFVSLALLDTLTTYVGRSKGYVETNPLLANFNKNLGTLVQIALYATVLYMFDRLHVAGQFIAIALPAYAVTRNIRALLVRR